jgi:hypothetical protein
MTEITPTEIHFRDEIVIDQPAKSSILSDAEDLLSQDNGPHLSIQMDATHSGLITNDRVYPGVLVRKSYKSYFSVENGGTADFNKPVLKHHNNDSDPIGRIVGGQFIKYKSGDEFKKDYLNPDTAASGGRGSGVVRLNANIADPDAIAKIIDGRLLSISSGHSTDSMACSRCGKQILDAFSRLLGAEEDEDGCKHVPGVAYKDEYGKGVCFGITGKLRYHEVSFINLPAQQPSKLTKIDWEAVKMSDSENGTIILPSSMRGKKSLITSMILKDNDTELDLLTARDRRLNNPVSVSMAAVDIVTSSVLDELSSEDEPDLTTEPDPLDDTKDIGSGASSRLGADSNSSRSVAVEGSGAASKGHRKTDAQAEESDNDNGRLESGDSMADKNDKKLSVDSLQSSIESLTGTNKTLQDNLEEKDKEIQSLEGQIEVKDTEVKRLSDDMAQMQGSLSKDYATIVAHYRILLKKPGTEGLDDMEAQDKYIDGLAKRSVESLRDSLNDLFEELKSEKEKADKANGEDTEMIDIEGDPLTSPALGSADGSEEPKEDTASELVDKQLA